MKLHPLAALLALSPICLAALPLQARPIAPPPPLPGLAPVPGQAPLDAAPGAASGRAASASLSPGQGSAAVTTTNPTTATAVSGNRQIVLELGKRTISLLEGSTVLGKWPVAIGDPATPTPTGRYSIRNKVVNPQYQSTKTGKNNPTIGANGPLGDRWLGFHNTSKDQFGIHGTPPAWAWAVHQGAAVTHGCVRMLGPHVRALFQQVDVGTPVMVKP
jgi:lipoprotein-anchoring transpeptidase ErfK/SrfK